MTFQQISRKFLVLIVTVSFFFSSVSSALAADNYGDYLGNQELNQPATLTAPSSDRPIKIYAQPDFKKSPLGKVQKGDRVTVLQQIEGNKGKQWDYVKFEQEDQKEGWIQQDYVAVQTQSNQKDQKPAQQSQSQSASSYSQQEDYSDTQQSSKYKDNQQQTYSQTKQNKQKSQSYQGNQ